ncbi:MAG: hypothetical protein ACRD8W_17685, partial [Nitrososphaeraceae archaeon]
MYNSTHDSLEENNSPRDLEQEQESKPDQVEKKPLPENISEYIQKAQDELKEYEEHKKFYETRRKKEIILDLAALLEKYQYPKDLLRSILARELGDYISTRYIEKIFAEKNPNDNEVKEQSTSQIANNTRNDSKIPIEVSYTGESIIINDKDQPDNNDPYLHGADDANSDVPSEIKTELKQQTEQDTGENVKVLQTQVNDLQTKCSRYEELVNEGLMWKEKYIRLQKELRNSKSNEMKKVIKGKTEIEFGSEFLPLTIEYNPPTNQFSALIPQEVIERVLAVLR